MVTIKVEKQPSAASNQGKVSKNKIIFDFFQKDINLFAAKFGDKKKERLFSELNLMLSSGLELNNALLIVKAYFKSKKDAEIVSKLQFDISNGATFHQALLNSNSFSTYDYFSAKIGEETGKLEIILQELALYYSKKIQLRRQFISALIYPAIVLFTAVLAIVFMMNFVIPMFAGVFSRFNTELPYITRLIIRISKLVNEWSWFGILSIILIILFYFSFKNKTLFKRVSSLILIKVPFLGSLIVKLYMARFCQSMKLLLSSKVHIIDALNLSCKMISFYPLDSVLPFIQADLMKGDLLSVAVTKFKIFDLKFLSMIKVGEEVNQLSKVFEKLEENYSREVEHQTKVLTSMLEPLLILFLGLLVGVILVAMYLPMFKLGYEIH